MRMTKDELAVKIITEFVALRAKIHAYRKLDKKLEGTCCKGTKKCVVAESLAFDYYNTCLFVGKAIYKEQICSRIRNKFYMVNKYKIALNRDDDNPVDTDVFRTSLGRVKKVTTCYKQTRRR